MTNRSCWSARADGHTRITAGIPAIQRGGHRRLADAQVSPCKQHRASAQHRLPRVVALAICSPETPIVNDGDLAPTRRHILASATYFKEYDVEPNPEDEDDDGKRRVARHSSVFNVAQVDGFVLRDTPATSTRVRRRFRARSPCRSRRKNSRRRETRRLQCPQKRKHDPAA